MKLIGLKFYDHSMCDPKRLSPIVCDVVGWLYAEDKLHYHIASWVCDGKRDDDNNEVFHVLKSTVVGKYEISARNVKKFRNEGKRRAKA